MALAARLGFWSSLLLTVVGVAYAAVMGAVFALKLPAFPPPDWLQLFGAVVSLTSLTLAVVMVACIVEVAPPHRRSAAMVGFGFTLLFAAVIAINRFVQVSVVRPALISGDVVDLRRWMPYEPGSAMFALEILGWGGFLGLAALALAWAFPGRGLERAICWLWLLYGVLGLTSAAGFVAGSPLVAVGFLAWGLVLFLVTGLLALRFHRLGRAANAG